MDLAFSPPPVSVHTPPPSLWPLVWPQMWDRHFKQGQGAEDDSGSAAGGGVAGAAHDDDTTHDEPSPLALRPPHAITGNFRVLQRPLRPEAPLRPLRKLLLRLRSQMGVRFVRLPCRGGGCRGRPCACGVGPPPPPPPPQSLPFSAASFFP